MLWWLSSAARLRAQRGHHAGCHPARRSSVLASTWRAPRWRIPACRAVPTSVVSATEFEKNITADFKFDVMPLAFDIKVSGGRAFQGAYGSSELARLKAGAARAVLSRVRVATRR